MMQGGCRVLHTVLCEEASAKKEELKGQGKKKNLWSFSLPWKEIILEWSNGYESKGGEKTENVGG